MSPSYQALPGRIVEYDPVTQSAEILICAEFIANFNTEYDIQVGHETLLGVPVHTASGGGWSVTFPIKKDDTCLILFSQVGFTHWLLDDKDKAGLFHDEPAPELCRGFTPEEALALVGFNTLPRAITSYATDGSQWRNANATQSIHLKEDGTIQIDTGADVVVNCVNANVTATADVTTTCVNSTVTATGTAHFETPLVTMSGNLTVTGTVSAAVGAFSGAVTAATFNGIVVETHEHAGDGGTGSGPSTGPPI